MIRLSRAAITVRFFAASLMALSRLGGCQRLKTLGSRFDSGTDARSSLTRRNARCRNVWLWSALACVCTSNDGLTALVSRRFRNASLIP